MKPVDDYGVGDRVVHDATGLRRRFGVVAHIEGTDVWVKWDGCPQAQDTSLKSSALRPATEDRFDWSQVESVQVAGVTLTPFDGNPHGPDFGEAEFPCDDEEPVTVRVPATLADRARTLAEDWETMGYHYAAKEVRRILRETGHGE